MENHSEADNDLFALAVRDVIDEYLDNRLFELLRERSGVVTDMN